MITPDPVENTTLVSCAQGCRTYPQMTRAGWCADYPDPQDWLSVDWQSIPTFARKSGYKNAEVDKLIDAGRVEMDPAKRAQTAMTGPEDDHRRRRRGHRSNTKNYFLIKPYVKGLDFTPQDLIARPDDEPVQRDGANGKTLAVWIRDLRHSTDFTLLSGFFHPAG